MDRLSSYNTQSWLSWFLRGLLFLGTLILLGRLIELQIIKGVYYRELSDGNRIRRVPITAPRGQILARGGEVLAESLPDKKRVVFRPESGFEKVDVEESESQDFITEWKRTYLMGELLGHLTGYVGEANEGEVGNVDGGCSEKGPRRLGSMVGRTGLEEEYECTLKGVDGEELVEVDTFGRRVRTLGIRQPTPGTSIKTTIDLALQKRVAAAMKDKVGAVVATDGLGQILAFYSSPSYDPNLFLEGKDSSEEISSLLKNENLPLFNRAISGAYHPGSIFKIVTATASLETGKIDRDFTYQDTGVITVNDFSYANWYFTQYGGVEGAVNLRRALARSTDTFFYKAGEALGPSLLASWAEKFGLGRPTGVDIPGEVGGLVPTPEWKKRVKDEPWYLGNTYHVAIGQGDLTTTPLQANILTSVIASGGRVCKPYLRLAPQSDCQELSLEPESVDEVRAGMVDACSSGGTGVGFFDFEPQVACKTGTAETSEENVTHAWFSVFAPYDEPTIVLTVLVEKGGEGSKVAAPVSHEILEYWFHEREDTEN